MFMGGDPVDLLPEVKKMPAVVCGRVGLLLGGAMIHVALEDTRLLYEQRSSICSQCRNKKACHDALHHSDTAFAPCIEEVICIQVGGAAIELSVAQETWAGLENPDCLGCLHKRQCLPMAA